MTEADEACPTVVSWLVGGRKVTLRAGLETDKGASVVDVVEDEDKAVLEVWDDEEAEICNGFVQMWDRKHLFCLVL